MFLKNDVKHVMNIKWC